MVLGVNVGIYSIHGVFGLGSGPQSVWGAVFCIVQRGSLMSQDGDHLHGQLVDVGFWSSESHRGSLLASIPDAVG